jgi:MATE family multidrug resistance protein
MLALSSILMKLFMLFSYFVDGFAYAGEALVGKWFGQKQTGEADNKELDRLVKLLFNWSLGVGLVFTLIYAGWGRVCVQLMTDDAVLLGALPPFMPWLIAMPIISTLAFMWDGIYIGATAGKQIRDAMIWAAVGFVVSYMALYKICDIQALYIAYFVHLAARVIYLTIGWSIFKKREINNLTDITNEVEG